MLKFKLCDANQPHTINSFQTIGWPDPFPDDFVHVKGTVKDGDNLRIPKHFEDLVYAKQRYNKDYSPACLYLPKKEIMLKMMRACIGVKKRSEFWLSTKKLVRRETHYH